MRIFLPVWGAKHKELMKKALLKSLHWPKNAREIDGAHWIIVTDKGEIDAEMSNEVWSYPELAAEGPHRGRILLKALVRFIRECVRNDDHFLMATPDYIFSEGSLANFRALGEGGVVSFAHMRVRPSILSELDAPKGSAPLLEIGMRHAHDAWTRSNVDAQYGVTFYGGISWQETADGALSVRHYLPAPFYGKFRASDADFFERIHGHPHDGTFALWDHLWPSQLIMDGRLRLLGSSDLGTMVEVTDSWRNLPPPNPHGVSNRTDYCNNLLHNQVQKQFLTAFRVRGQE